MEVKAGKKHPSWFIPSRGFKSTGGPHGFCTQRSGHRRLPRLSHSQTPSSVCLLKDTIIRAHTNGGHRSMLPRARNHGSGSFSRLRMAWDYCSALGATVSMMDTSSFDQYPVMLGLSNLSTR